ncbi:YeiH family protein [Propionicicella superfundia]|uniref:YeiH family protein n=1 Tax=Propionicicella superfundia TaxID=348582 RepID=UPI0003FDCEDE|nr:putative sulfate exporter family transporter [Propionicicella superfundia]
MRPLALLPGLAVSVLIAAAALGIGVLAPVLGAPVVAILVGLIVRQVAGLRPSWAAGVAFAAKPVLQASIVLFGAGMSLRQIAEVGADGLPVMLGTLAIALCGGYVLGRLLRVEPDVGALVTYGTAICGASAIATMSAVIGASGATVAYAITVIVVFNVLGALLFPVIGHALGLSGQAFALWAGTAVNDTSSVVAAATAYGGAAVAAAAVVVKLTRTLAIVPLALVESWRRQRKDAQSGGRRIVWWRLVPAFLVFFLLAAGVNSLGVIPDAAHEPIRTAATVGTTIAMAGVGLSASLKELRATGLRPLLLGGMLWVVVAASSLALQAISHHW